MILAIIRRRFFPTQTQRMRDASRKLGQRGENAAASYLVDTGYEILSRNYQAPHGIGELDVVARNLAGTICIIEVKTRRERPTGLYPTDPRFAVNAEKRRRLLLTTRAWLRECHFEKQPPIRYDIIEIWAENAKPTRLKHWPNAFTHS